jgi:dienelactone hydrolase
MRTRDALVVVVWAVLAGRQLVCQPATTVTPQPVPPTPAASPSGPVAGVDYEALARTVVADLAARRFDKVFAQFNDTVASLLPADKLAYSWDRAALIFGEFKSIETVKREEKQGHQVVHLICAFARQKVDMAIAFDEHQRIAGLLFTPAATTVAWSQPAYAKSDSFHEREVTIGRAPWQLPGILTLPNGPGPFPAVVLVHGSGAHDRDETIGPNKTFKDLAWGLASQGIAVLRYDKRTLVHGAEMAQPNNFTVKEETVEDAQAAVDLLAAQHELQAKHVFVLGHSLGGYLGPRIAAGDAKVAGLVLFAGNSRPMEELLVEQIRHQVESEGKITTQGQEQIDEVEKEEAAIRNPDLKPGVTVKFLGVPMPSSYFLDLRNYHPAELAATLHIPILVLQGERDINVRMADFDGWKKSLGNQPTAIFKTYPALNHLFVQASAAADSPGSHHVPEEVLQDIAGWVKANSR